MLRKALYTLAVLLLASVQAGAQIVNLLNVDRDSFKRYAYCRMQMFSEDNLPIADSLYAAGQAKGDYKLKCLGLSLEFPVRFARGESGEMDRRVQEIIDLTLERKEARSFYLGVLHEWCQYLIHEGRISEAMLQAREMERLSVKEKNPLGKLYAYRIIGLIQSHRSNSYLAIENFTKAVRFCKEARSEQELPNLYILIAQEYTRLQEFVKAGDYCMRAEEYQSFFPSIRLKALMTRAYLYNARGQNERFWLCYDEIVADPLYSVQADADSRYALDAAYLRSKGLFEEALAAADALSTSRERHSLKHGIYADMGSFRSAYSELSMLMNEKDSVYIRVQNEDLAILDAEMNNAQLREEAQKLKSQNQMMILIGFLVMFAIAFFAILLSQWQLRQNLDEMRRKNNEALRTRRAFQKAMDAKESENAYKIKILQNRTTNRLSYEDLLNI